MPYFRRGGGVFQQTLNHSFGRGAVRRQVLFDVALEVEKGEIVLLTGPSGSGKTTLLTLIGGLRAAQSGSLRVLGRELMGGSDRALTLARREHGYIFQAHNLHRSLTATQNVRMALEMRGTLSTAEMDRRARRILESVGLGDHLEMKPDQLSGGQKQRVAVARALVGEPPLLLADEPTAALDSRSGREVVTLMQRLAREQGCTILLVTHDSRILDVADRTVSMEDGRLR
ncbi:ATP-binding cassette domain-containing protein [Synechococcus sp. CBW1006]|uniref:ATP-binding cassette domain-containing protein n=1 Tax=Synechococcus sp. CBW1006 TaxID=1353138 RepID=UPI0018CE2451|nr:ATP-binding cassette domain-containing protein [Synechococcus sp. CBW1006]QPN65667.1 ATP-binding cassette domain-containing protein [Synechococcus sp. CBW1006]